ncbi:hypothetical protein BEP19_13760 [Ammoniphilus oxalaticus]|uniref:Uncharacterized protein n=1 Tax=Ammoniphilus oxalaticus TaxID=66863 RepID=A0A419SEC9_9BACL|nr:hypothetical protein [Ammoniphilus oxalaticus]RKD21695.1 hypothetical protein BEP19_13760 [Ammoniphilus oxalaticus]
MKEFMLQIESITSCSQLQSLKESIKDEVIHPQLRWDERMILYKQVQLINERITQLTLTVQPTL